MGPALALSLFVVLAALLTPRSRSALLLALARPRVAVLVSAMAPLGYGYGLWEQGSTVSPFVVTPTLAHLAVVWLLIHGGAMWLNAVLDRDVGAVLLGRSVEVPRGTAATGYGALALSIAGALPLGAVATSCAASCAALAVLYSHPRVALKGHPLGGPLTNALGYAVFPPIAGWSLSGAECNWRALLTLGALVLGILGLYFAAQAFQADEDRQRGYRTLVVTRGPAFTLRAARACFAVAMLELLFGAASGIYPRAFLLAALPCAMIDGHFARWAREPNGGDARWAAALVGRAVVVLLVVLGAAYAHHFAALAQGGPVAGRATAIVP